MTQREWSGHVFIGMSVDGMIARADDSLDWLMGGSAGGADDPSDSGFNEFMASVDHLVMGRSTYDVVRGMGEWFYGETPVFVLSTTLQAEDPRIRVARSLEEVTAMLDDDGARNVYVDGGRTVRSFLAAGMISTLTLTRLPILIGEGKPLFGAVPSDVRLRLDDVKTFDGGAVQTRYTVL
ncbi:dihydrofolate reductase family protein [Arthrobacter sp.]|uniref:dihydrofolate reductase family protein n=1 Tax=Arthrobacter sp. TaxID=1667 RepID=UPI00281147D3|nr:dihydrofolate reductase family protein [Arthrobacter sp.]